MSGFFHVFKCFKLFIVHIWFIFFSLILFLFFIVMCVVTVVYGKEGFYLDFLFPTTFVFRNSSFPLYSSNREISHSYKEVRCIFSYLN